jgi:hypothetical protein
VLENLMKRYVLRIEKQRERQLSIEGARAIDAEGQEVAKPDRLPAGGETPEEVVLHRFDAEQVRAFARTLKPNEQEVFHGYFELELTEHGQVARPADPPEGAGVVARARTVMRLAPVDTVARTPRSSCRAAGDDPPHTRLRPRHARAPAKSR